MDVRLVYEADVWMEGLYGIQAARYYLDVHPDARLCVLESEGVVGGGLEFGWVCCSRFVPCQNLSCFVRMFLLLGSGDTFPLWLEYKMDIVCMIS